MGQIASNRRRLPFAAATDNSTPIRTEINRHTADDDTHNRRTDSFPSVSGQKSGQICLIEGSCQATRGKLRSAFV